MPVPKPPRMVIKLDGQELKGFAIRSDRNFGGLFDVVARVSLGKHRLAVAFTNEFHDPGETDPRRQDRSFVVSMLQTIGPLAPNDPASFPESHQQIFFCRPAALKPTAAERTECARKIIRRFASRAIEDRRPKTNSIG